MDESVIRRSIVELRDQLLRVRETLNRRRYCEVASSPVYAR